MGTKGFSILEVIISIGVIVVLTLSVVVMMRSNIDMNQIISSESQVTSGLSKAMTQIASDIEHSYIISTKDVIRSTNNRNSGTIFNIESSNSKIKLTTNSYRRYRRGEKSSDLVYVVYELKKSKINSGRSDLYRGIKKVIPKDFKEDPEMELFVENIKTFQVLPWNGERFIKDRWDSQNSDTTNKAPMMVRVTLETWLNPPGEEGDEDFEDDKKTEKLITRLYLRNSAEYAELKEQLGTMKFHE